MKMSKLDITALVLSIIGALDLALAALFNLDIIHTIFGYIAWLAGLVYLLVGLSGLYMIYAATRK